MIEKNEDILTAEWVEANAGTHDSPQWRALLKSHEALRAERDRHRKEEHRQRGIAFHHRDEIKELERRRLALQLKLEEATGLNEELEADLDDTVSDWHDALVLLGDLKFHCPLVYVSKKGMFITEQVIEFLQKPTSRDARQKPLADRIDEAKLEYLSISVKEILSAGTMIKPAQEPATASPSPRP